MTGRNSTTTNTLLFIILFIASAFMVSCSVGEYLAAYFNTYFNASRLFAEAEDEIASQKKTAPQDTTFLPDYSLPASTKTKLTSVVEKCSKLLQYHPESSLVDNSLMMIGKSYYYQNELQRGERKFAELRETHPESDLVPEATLFLSYTYYRMKEYDRAVEVAASLADTTGEGDDDVAASAFYLIGQVHYEKEEFVDAVTAFRFSAERAGAGEKSAAAKMRIGAISMIMENPDGALLAYRNAEEDASEYSTEYHARMSQVGVYTRIGELNNANDILEDLRSNSIFKEYDAEIDLEIADIMMLQNRLDEASEQYYYVDTAYARTEVAAKSHYRLGYLYETELHNYDSALAVYGRGKTQSPKAEITREIVRRADLLQRYQTISMEIARLSAEKRMIFNPELRDTLASPSEPDSLGGETSPDSSAERPSPPPLPSIETVDSALARNKADLAGLFYSGLVVIDSALFWYQNILDEHPQSPFAARALYTEAQIYSDGKAISPSVIDALYHEIILKYPETEFADEAGKILGIPPREEAIDPAIDLYAEAESLMIRESTISALDSFKVLVHQYPSSPLAPKANYAIAWIYEQSSSSTDSAVAYYNRLVELYPSSTYSNAATKKLQSVPKKEGEPVNGVEMPEVEPADRLGDPDEPGIKETPADSIGGGPEESSPADSSESGDDPPDNS